MSVLACFGLSVPSKLTVVLFSGRSSFFPPGDISSGSVLLANIKKLSSGTEMYHFIEMLMDELLNTKWTILYLLYQYV